MKRLPFVGAFLSAVAATACCLPPLLFLIFGVSFSFLGFLELLTPYRIPLTLLSLLFLVLAFRKRKMECVCEVTQKRYRLFGIVMVVVIAVILIYPEVANLFLE